MSVCALDASKFFLILFFFVFVFFSFRFVPVANLTNSSDTEQSLNEGNDTAREEVSIDIEFTLCVGTLGCAMFCSFSVCVRFIHPLLDPHLSDEHSR